MNYEIDPERSGLFPSLLFKFLEFKFDLHNPLLKTFRSSLIQGRKGANYAILTALDYQLRAGDQKHGSSHYRQRKVVKEGRLVQGVLSLMFKVVSKSGFQGFSESTGGFQSKPKL